MLPAVASAPSALGRLAKPLVFPPRLENGDQLSSEEFLRRYDTMPELKKAELVEGIVYMGSPVSLVHSQPDQLIQIWLGNYALRTPGVEHVMNTTVILDPDNTFQPDGLLRLLPERGGQTGETETRLLTGAPELVVETAASSVSIDGHSKFRVYQRAGVREYLVWLVEENELRWFELRGQRFTQASPDSDGLIHSRTFPGLLLNVRALLARDAARVLDDLQRSLQSPEYLAFRTLPS